MRKSYLINIQTERIVQISFEFLINLDMEELYILKRKGNKIRKGDVDIVLLLH